MRQHKITSASFHTPGSNPNLPDAYVDPAALAQLRKDAGIDTLGIISAESDNHTEVLDPQLPNKGKYQQHNNIKPGTEAWFKLWFGQTK